MNKLKADLLKACVMGFLVPSMLLGFAMGISQEEPQEPEATLPPVLEQTVPTTTAPPPTTEPTLPPPAEPEVPEDVDIRVSFNGYIQVMKLEDYLLGVLLAEMPVTFHEEALKAQAVASRTYTLRCCTNPNVHSGGAVCTKPSCCQGYVSPEQYMIHGGKYENLEKMRKACQETAGQVMTYEGKLILSTYFSCSGGNTEDAMEFWGMDYPYLQSVLSPGEEIAEEAFAASVTFSPQDFATAMGISPEGEPEGWFGHTDYTSAGSVLGMEISGAYYKGLDIRKALGLRSSAFTIEIGEDGITFYTRGYGHRVGMSQYGAEAMAQAGSTFDTILHHYYTDIVIEQYAV